MFRMRKFTYVLLVLLFVVSACNKTSTTFEELKKKHIADRDKYENTEAVKYKKASAEYNKCMAEFEAYDNDFKQKRQKCNKEKLKRFGYDDNLSCMYGDKIACKDTKRYDIEYNIATECVKEVPWEGKNLVWPAECNTILCEVTPDAPQCKKDVDPKLRQALDSLQYEMMQQQRDNK